MSAELIDFKEIKILDAKLIGKEIKFTMNHTNWNQIRIFWMECFKDGTFKVIDNSDWSLKNVMIGWSGNFDEKNNIFSYLAGYFVKKTFNVPDYFKTINFAETDFACGTIKGTEPDIYYRAYELTKEESIKRNLPLNEIANYSMEWYDESFNPDDDEKVIKYLIPIYK